MAKLNRLFGKNAIYFYNVAKGMDTSRVTPRSGVKSISNQRTLGKTINDEKEIKETLDHLADMIFKRLKKSKLEFKTVTIHIPFDAKTFHSKSISLKFYSDSMEVLKKTAHQLWDEYISPEITSVRRISLKVTNLREKSKQKELTDFFKK